MIPLIFPGCSLFGSPIFPNGILSKNPTIFAAKFSEGLTTWPFRPMQPMEKVHSLI